MALGFGAPRDINSGNAPSPLSFSGISGEAPSGDFDSLAAPLSVFWTFAGRCVGAADGFGMALPSGAGRLPSPTLQLWSSQKK